MKIEEAEKIRDRIRMTVVQEIQSINIVAQQSDPNDYLPRFIENVTQSLHELVIDEIIYGKRRLH